MLLDTVTRRLAQQAAIHLIAVLWMGGAQAAHAQIYEWLDDSNDRHFANSLERVPDEHRASAKLVVNPPSAPAAPETDTESPSDADRLDESEEQFASGWDAGFGAGWEAGFRAAEEQQPVCPAEPVVVTMESPPVVLNVPRYDPAGAYYRSPYAGGMTVPFDDGASRGLTQRQRIQEMRTRERGW